MSRSSMDSREADTAVLLDEAAFHATYRQWRDRIRAEFAGGGSWAIVGIKRRGSVLARRLWEDLRGAVAGLEFGEVDISLYRDDYHLQLSQPQVLGTEIAFPVDGRGIVLVDDVLFTGRTVRAAIDLILDFGRPRKVELAVFVDRGHRELPIAADFIGRTITTRPQDRIQVRLREMDGRDCVIHVRESGA